MEAHERRTILPRRTMLGLAACLAAACTPAPEPTLACTMIGCDDGLAVVLEAPPAGSYRIVASAEGEEDRIMACSPDAPCGERVFFADFQPESVTIRVITGTDTLTRTAQPEWQDVQPNGPACPPTCRQATVTITP